MSDVWTDPLLPPQQTRLEAAIGRAIPSVGLTPEIIATLWSPSECPTALLPWLAWALSVDEWDDSWREATRRAVCAASLPLHKKKGTVGAVRRAMNSIGYRSRLIEAHAQQPQGAPHTFIVEIEIDDRGLDGSIVKQMERQVAAVKPERSHFDVLLVGRSDCLVSVAAASISGESVTITPFNLTHVDAPALRLHFGATAQAFGATSVYPLQ